MTQPVRIYSDPSHATPDKRRDYLVGILKAFWGDGTNEWERYRPEHLFYLDLFELVPDIDRAEIVILPMIWNYYLRFKKMPRALHLAKQAEKAGKKICIWINGDFGARIPVSNAIVFQTSAFRSRKAFNIRIRSDNPGDLTRLYFEGSIPVRNKGPKPVVGFYGQTRSKRFWRLFLYNFWLNLAYWARLSPYEPPKPVFPHLIFREKVLNRLLASPLVEARIVGLSKSTGKTMQVNPEWIHNMRDCDYVVCIRGTANYSNRFYGALSMGRIPIFVDTDCALPFHDEIDWKKHCVWVDQKDAMRIDEKVAEFHRAHSEIEFIKLQRACRELWLERLSDEGFYRHFREYVLEPPASSLEGIQKERPQP